MTVVGMGRTALAVVKLLLREGARPFVTEAKSGNTFAQACVELEALGVPYELGGHTGAAFEGASLIVPSPGVPPAKIPLPASCRADVISEMEFAFPYCRSRIIAVTGTNGKTTTTELLKTLLAGCGRSVGLAGNNDVPLSAVVTEESAPEYLVLEVSSYQLELAHAFRPWAAAVLNVTPDHLARHGTIENYAAVKARIYTNQDVEDLAVVNDDDPFVRAMADSTCARLWPFSLEHRLHDGLWLDGESILLGDECVAQTSDTLLPGRHNLQNVLCALSIMRAGGFDWNKTLAALRTFGGVEHRIEFVVRACGVDFYNDSKATNVDSLKVALESFSIPVVLIAGGEGKGSDYRVLRDLIRQRVRHLVLIGDDAPKIEVAYGDLVPFECATDMRDAVQRAAAAAQPGDAVLLSPACASFDMYTSFEHRGRVFKDAVMDYARGTREGLS
ncbi:MAG: UDP-N-acetylmuramoyl-L-alanine--D-glutamate ligase [Candidatus Hydrogenedentes bacterium]|nr:UDP-N-acetylmuramoyl-L-alanine--D-glutamate ligase [Candidatus Hydrogenedentota bacterium]